MALAAVAAVLVTAPAAAAATGDQQVVKLSNETTTTLWAHPGSTALIRFNPSLKSHALRRLHLMTEDGFPEIYIALAKTTDEFGRQWIKIRVPMRPNGKTGWVPRDALGNFHTVHAHLVVNRHRLRATLWYGKRKVWSSPVGVGKPGTPTPAGRFYIRERIKALKGGTIYGPYAFGTSDYSTLSDWPGGGIVGIHGTNEPNLIPGRPSHGCIRLPNAKVTRLWHLLPLGTPLRVL
ncbi:MAG TPA: L,D-transpeptidase [Thermoleophilaceae bacterium]